MAYKHKHNQKNKDTQRILLVIIITRFEFEPLTVRHDQRDIVRH